MDSANTISHESLQRASANLESSTARAKRSKMVFQTRCNPKANFKLIHSMKGDEGFRRLLCDLGLDSLLHLQLTRLQRELCADLARRVHVRNSTDYYMQSTHFNFEVPKVWVVVYFIFRFDECLMAKPTLQSWTYERVNVVLKLMREQGGIQSNRVIVRLTGIPHVDATVDDYILPQVLVHEVLISRLKVRLDDKGTRQHQTVENPWEFMKQLEKRIQCVEDLHRSGDV